MIVETAGLLIEIKTGISIDGFLFDFHRPQDFVLLHSALSDALFFWKKSDSITHQFDNNLICWEPSSLPIYFDSLFYIHFYI